MKSIRENCNLKNSINIFFALFLLGFACGCKDTPEDPLSSVEPDPSSQIENNPPDSLPLDEYIDWVESCQKLYVEKQIDDISFSAFYKPQEYVAAKEMDKKDTLIKNNFYTELSEINGFQYFNFRIEAKGQNVELLKYGGVGGQEYAARVEYFSFKMQNDLKLIDSGDTLDCKLFHFERTYGVVPYSMFIVGFPLPKSELASKQHKSNFINSDKTLVYEDRIFKKGKINLVVKSKYLNTIPKLKL